MKNLKVNETLFINKKQYKLYKKSLVSNEKSIIKNTEIPKVKRALDDFEKNHDWSWYDEIYDRNKNNMDATAIFYRGREITYSQMFENANKYIASMKTYGLDKGYELPVCVKNSPELIYLMLAASKVGVKLNIFGSSFDPEYITEILNGSDSDILFAHEEEYRKIKPSVDSSKINKKVLFSLSDSLDNGIDPFREIDSKFIKFDSTIDELKQSDSDVLTSFEFLEIGKEYDIDNLEHCGLDDIFTITYTSGSTNTTRPKAIVHKTRSFTTMGRFHGDDLSGLPSTKQVKSLVHIPPYSNTNLITCISDTLYQRGTVAIEPIYNKDFFLNSLIINQPHFAAATRCFYLEAAKAIMFDEKYKNLQLPNLYIPTVVGEAMSLGEEKFINTALKKAKAGKDKLPFPLSPVKVSFGGGDCEHGGLFFTLYRECMRRLSLSKLEYGLKPFSLADIAVLREDKTLCNLGELGILASNSPCTMKEYKDNPEATNDFFVKDEMGNIWGDNKAWAYIDGKKNVHMKGRVGNDFTLKNGELYPLFFISDCVLEDTKNILSCEVVHHDTAGKRVIVIHIEMYPTSKKNPSDILKSLDQRLSKFIPQELYNDVVYRVHSREEGYPLTGSGKRNILSLQNENLKSKWIKIIKQNGNLEIIPYSEYQEISNDTKNKVYEKKDS